MKADTIKLRKWQSEAVEKSIQWLITERNDRRFLINAAPGAGKTICASVIAAKLIDLGEVDRVIVIAPMAEVVKTWAKEFEFVTGRIMVKKTNIDDEFERDGEDICATWAATQKLLDGYQKVCRESRVLLICDEHHHAAVSAAWGEGASNAFADAKFSLILTGTPIRSDGEEPVWFAYTDEGKIEHPEGGTYTLTYGAAVEEGYCNPITFHRYEGNFTVEHEDGEKIKNVTGSNEILIPKKLKSIKGISRALEFYTLARTPIFKSDGITPDSKKSFQAQMFKFADAKLDDARNLLPNAGGLIIAPSIPMAIYMADLIKEITGEKPVVVHSAQQETLDKISTFRRSKKRWIVSVAMISEGVDIKRLRVLFYLPNAQTELFFRQAMGRVVRTIGDNDESYAHVVMPNYNLFESYALRVENEMSPEALKKMERPIREKKCPECGDMSPIGSQFCIHSDCGYEFPVPPTHYKECDECKALNPINIESCQECGSKFKSEFIVTLNNAVRVGAIVRGMDIDENDVRLTEKYRGKWRAQILATGNSFLINFINTCPPEGLLSLYNIIDQDVLSEKNSD